MAAFDPTTATLAPGEFDPSSAVLAPPPPPRSALGEVGTGIKRGALVGLPSLIGKTMQYASDPGNKLYEMGRGLVSNAESRGERSDLALRPQEHGTVVNALAAGGEMLAPSVAIPLAVGGGAALAGLTPFAATAAAAAAGGALFGAEAGQTTLEKGRAAGLDDATAKEAARVNAATTMASQTGLGMIGGQLLGTFGRTGRSILTRESAPLAERTLADLAGTNGVLKPLLKQMPLSTAEAVGVNAAQSAASAGIERAYGVDNTSPLDAAGESIAPTLGLTALMGPLALVGRAMNVRAAKTRTESLAHPESPEGVRTQLANVYAERLAQVDPAAAAAFRQNAEVAIQNKMALEVDSRLLSPDAVTPPRPDPGTPLLGRDPTAGNMVVFPDGTTGFRSDIENHIASLPEDQQLAARARLAGMGSQPATPNAFAQPAPAAIGFDAGRVPNAQGELPLYTFPDGTVTRDIGAVESFISKLPDTEQTAARAKLLNLGPQNRPPISPEAVSLHEQVRRTLTEGGVEPARPLSREEFAATDAGKGKSGQALAKAYRGYLANPETQRELMTRDADAFDALAQRPPEAEPNRNPARPDAGIPASDAPANTAMADAMARAFKAHDEALAYAERDATKARETEAIANIAKGEQLAADAEAGRIQGDPNAPKPIETIRDDWKTAMATNDMDVKPQSMVPFMKRVEALGIEKMATHAEQIAALESIAADKKASQGVRDRASMLAEQWKKDMPQEEKPPVDNIVETPPAAEAKPAPVAAVETPAIAGQPSAVAAAALGQNIPAKAPDNSPAPAALKAAVADLPANTQSANVAPTGPMSELRSGAMPASVLAESAADRVMELRMGFTERIRKGEQLSPLEKERYEDLNAFAQTLNQYVEGRAKPSDADFVKAIAKMVDEASQPYKKTLRKVEIPGPKMADPDQSDMGLLAPAALSHKAADVMVHLAKDGSAPWVKDLAAKLQPLMGETTIWPEMGMAPDRGIEVSASNASKGVVAEYDLAKDSIHIYKASESTILHESIHAVTAARIVQAQRMQRPATQAEATLKRSFDELTKVYDDAAKLPNAKSQYGMESIHEFVAELHSNAGFRDFLRGNGLMDRIVNAIRSMLGLQPRDNQLVSRALDASEALFSPERLSAAFDASPEGAAQATGASLRRVIDDADRRAFSVDTGTAALNILRGVLPLQTVSYIANRARAIPEMVQSGFTAGLDAFQRANASHDVILNRLNDVGSKYVTQVERTLKGLDEPKARAVQAEMMTIGGEASRIGFDFRKNGRDNIAADKSIDPADKAYIDDIHRRWTQLQRQHPEVAKLLEEGEKINRRSLIEKVSTIAANLMDDRAGRVRHLEAELARLTPQDAAYARKADELALANTENLMASRFAKGLDLMDASLTQGQNPDPVRFHDTATAKLGGRLQQAFDAARTLPEGSPLKTAMQSLESMYAKEAKHPYFSLGRDGEFFVKVDFKGIDARTNERIQDALKGTNKVVGDLTRGDSNAFFRVRSAHEAQALHDKLVAAGEGKVLGTAWGRTVERVQDVSSASPALRTLLSQVDDMQMGNLSREQADQVKQALTRQLLSMLPETAARNAQMGRRGVPGYDADFLTRYSQRAVGAVHDTAGIYTSRAYIAAAEARKAAIEQLNRDGSADGRQRAQLIDDEINKRYSNMMKPMGRDWVSNATSLSHSFYLGMSPAYFIRSFVGPWQRGLAFVGSKYGFAGSAAELFSAQATSMKLVANSFKAALNRDGVRGLLGSPIELEGLGLNEREMGFVREMHANGKLDLGESAQLARMAIGAGGNRKMQDAVRMAAMTSQYAEMANRFALGLAAYRQAVKRPQLLAKGMTPESYALQAIEMGLDDFSPANTARAIGKHGWAGQMTPLFAQFQNYNLQTMQQIARTVHDGFFGQDKSPEGLQRSKEARREFAGLMAATATIAGTLGLPFANAFAGVYNSLMTDPDDPKDVRVAMRNWAVETFGREMGTVLTKGLPSLMNMDTGTMGMQGILPGSDFLADRTMFKERSEAQVRNALGPAVSLGLDLPEAVSRMMEGNWLKGVEAALPVGLRSFYKTAQMAGAIGPGGYTDSKGNPLPLQAGASDLAWRALGFQSETKATQGEAQRDFIINQQRLEHRRKMIGDAFVKGSLDPAKLPDAVSALQGFNEKNPMQPMGTDEVSGAVRGYRTRYALGEASGLGIPVTRKAYPVLLESERFAAMPSR